MSHATSDGPLAAALAVAGQTILDLAHRIAVLEAYARAQTDRIAHLEHLCGQRIATMVKPPP